MGIRTLSTNDISPLTWHSKTSHSKYPKYESWPVQLADQLNDVAFHIKWPNGFHTDPKHEASVHSKHDTSRQCDPDLQAYDS